MTLIDESLTNLYRAADYIQNHFAENLSLDKLASVAHYSKYHFHRLFREHFGEAVNDRIRRVRLERAAHKLVADLNASVDAIAVSCGYSSGQNFAREFKAHFGDSPTAFRKSSGSPALHLLHHPQMKPSEKKHFRW